jgi:hypothetical protein
MEAKIDAKKIDHELRTTFALKLPSSMDVVTIAKQIRGAKICATTVCAKDYCQKEVRGPKTALA